MDYEIKDCIDSGSKYCPCHLAETGDCILCSHLNNTTFCDCKNWRGTCIYKEFINNGYKAKEERETHSCKIAKKLKFGNDLIILDVEVNKALVESLVNPGSYVFVRNPKSNSFYDAPISVMKSDTSKDIITLSIEIKGIKTKSIDELKENETILIRGPFWNGVLGLKNIKDLKDKKTLLICRGIGYAPMIPVIKRLYSNGNEINLLLDSANIDKEEIIRTIDTYNVKPIELNTIENGKLSASLKDSINEILSKNEISLVHIAGPDILISEVINYIGDKYKFSCCNNAKMCCGEGICGTCSVRYKGHVVKKLCKVQVDPKYIFEGRRYL